MNVVQSTTKYEQHKNRPFSCSFVYKKKNTAIIFQFIRHARAGHKKTALAKHTNDTAARLEPPIVSTPPARPYEDYGGGEHPSLLATQCKSAAQHTKTHKKNIRFARIIRSTRERAANNTFQVVSRNLRTIKRPFRTSVGRMDAASV